MRKWMFENGLSIAPDAAARRKAWEAVEKTRLSFEVQWRTILQLYPEAGHRWLHSQVENSKGRDVLWEGYQTQIPVHRVILTPKEIADAQLEATLRSKSWLEKRLQQNKQIKNWAPEKLLAERQKKDAVYEERRKGVRERRIARALQKNNGRRPEEVVVREVMAKLDGQEEKRRERVGRKLEEKEGRYAAWVRTYGNAETRMDSDVWQQVEDGTGKNEKDDTWNEEMEWDYIQGSLQALALTNSDSHDFLPSSTSTAGGVPISADHLFYAPSETSTIGRYTESQAPSELGEVGGERLREFEEEVWGLPRRLVGVVEERDELVVRVK